jgi:hypothetical protein
MNSLAHQRCFNHAAREAAARCPECKQFFCRECITEHDDRVLCTSCLKRLAATPTERRAFGSLRRIVQCAFGFVVAWFFFFLIGEVLAGLPDSFHEGTVWRVPWSER